MLMPVVQLRGTPCLHPCLLPFAGLSSGGLVAANPRQPLRAPWASARARSGNCSAILGSNWNAWSRPTSLDRASPPTVIRSTRRPWRYVSSIRAGAQATSASVWPGAADAAVLPSERTLQRWFRQQHQPPAAPGRRPLDPDVAGHCPPRHLADGCRGTATPGQRSRRLLAASGRRIQWCLPWHHGFPPTTSGAMSCRPRCSSSCGRRSPAGDCPASCVWTTASRGVRGAICLRPWRAVADRLGHRHDLERPVLPSAERGRRAFARDSEALGGAPHLWQCSRTANPAG